MAANNTHAVAFTGHRKERILQNGNPCIFGQIQLSVIEQVERKNLSTFLNNQLYETI